MPRGLRDLEASIRTRKAELEASEPQESCTSEPDFALLELSDDLVQTNAYLMWLDRGHPAGVNFEEASRRQLANKLRSGR